MNKENIEKAIAIMKRAGKVDMLCWQDNPNTIKEEINMCGTSACFAGWVAVSPEFKASGGDVDEFSGTPMLYRYNNLVGSGVSAMAIWLGISNELADSLVLGNTEEYDGEDDEDSYMEYS